MIDDLLDIARSKLKRVEAHDAAGQLTTALYSWTYAQTSSAIAMALFVWRSSFLAMCSSGDALPTRPGVIRT